MIRANQFNILLVDDEPQLRVMLKTLLTKAHADMGQDGVLLVRDAEDGQQAMKSMESEEFDLVFMDVLMPHMDGFQALLAIKESHPTTMVVMVTAHGNIADAKRAIRDGAFDYLEKPVREQDCRKLLEKVLQSRKLAQQAGLSYPILSQDSEAGSLEEKSFIGQSGQMRRIFSLINRLANVNTSVLIRGENGTGKELVARAIHFNSPRKDKPFVAINCAAIPENLIESELFGHEKGAFTGADMRKIGKFQYATGGTLFLDEVGDLALPLQVKLLRVLQERVFTPVGANREVKSDARILAATNRPLEDLIEQGKFREDLFYRLNVMPIFLPPLRQRQEDIEPLALHFIQQFNQEHERLTKGFAVKGLNPVALSVLKNYSWPGNIRELENAIEYAFILQQGEFIDVEHLPPSIAGHLGSARPKRRVLDEGEEAEFADASLSDYRAVKESFEKEFIIQALKTHKGRINATVEQAQIPKNTLLRKIKKYGINPKDYED